MERIRSWTSTLNKCYLIKNMIKLKGHTLIEVSTAVVVSSIISLAIYFVFTNSSKNINDENMLMDIKNYTSSCLEIISKKLRSADEIDINNIVGSNSITIKTSENGNEETYTYSIINNVIYENSQPLKIYGDFWLTDNEDNYNLTLTMNCEQALDDIFDASDNRVRENMYNIDLNVFIESELNDNYSNRYKASRSILAINKLVKTPIENS